MSVQDCFWVIANGNVAFTADVYTPEITEGN